MHEVEVRRICKMEEVLSEIEERQDTHRNSLAETWDAVVDLRTKVDVMQADIREIKTALLGDMHKHKGLVTRVHEVEQHHEAMWRRIDEMAAIIAGKGDSDRAGIVERVRTLEIARARTERLGWLIVAAVIGQCVLIVRDLIMGGM